MIYKIKKGKHSYFHFPKLQLSNKLTGYAVFDSSCLYNFDNEDKYDINKLCGLSASWYHHKDSARLGWRCVDGKVIEIFAYYYINSERVWEHLDTIRPFDILDFCIEFKNNRIYTTIHSINGGKTKITPFKKPPLIKYQLFPYFGGNKSAPHDVYITIRNSKEDCCYK